MSSDLSAGSKEEEVRSGDEIEVVEPEGSEGQQADIADVLRAAIGVAAVVQAARIGRDGLGDRVLIHEVRTSDIGAVAGKGYRLGLGVVVRGASVAKRFSDRMSQVASRVADVAAKRMDDEP